MNEFKHSIEGVVQLFAKAELSKLGAELLGIDDVDVTVLRQAKRTIGIINSMTPEERAAPAFIDHQRAWRIAHGSGTRLEEVELLLRTYRIVGPEKSDAAEVFRNIVSVRKCGWSNEPDLECEN